MIERKLVSIEGTIAGVMPSDHYSVLSGQGEFLYCALGGTLLRQRQRLAVGDRVTVALDLASAAIPRIVHVSAVRSGSTVVHA